MHVGPKAREVEGLRWWPDRSIRCRTWCKGGEKSPRSPKSKEPTQAQANGDARQEGWNNRRMAVSRTG